MKILIIRHGDPDYAADSLTEKGWREAEYLSERLMKLDIKEFYVSPLGRAKDTASCTLKKLHRTAIECEWLREFAVYINRPDVKDRKTISWDWLPQDWTTDERLYLYDKWYEVQPFQEANVKQEYDWIVSNFDALLSKHGYVREGHLYRAEKPNSDTIVLFCHFGLGSVLLSHLMSISPMVLWHNTCMSPTAVTTVVTEERKKGIASFRVLSLGDISHLYAKEEPPSFAARFCETFKNDIV